MTDPSYMGRYSVDQGCYKLTHLGTAAGTQTIVSQPAFFSHIQINARAASGVILAFDCAGTAGTAAGNLIGSIALGTQTFSDPSPYIYKGATNAGLTLVWTANLDFTVAALQ